MLVKNSDFQLTLPSDREIVYTRTLDAPSSLVFEAWTQPEHVKKWWGCHEATLPVCEIDLRVGGSWRYVMRMPDGSEHPFKGVYREVDPGRKLVYTECYDSPAVGCPEWLTTITFEEMGGRTKLTNTGLFPSREARDGAVKSGMADGAPLTMDRLADCLEEMR